MATCANCGHRKEAHRPQCGTYTVPAGWCTCEDFTPATNVGLGINMPGVAVAKKFYEDTKRFAQTGELKPPLKWT